MNRRDLATSLVLGVLARPALAQQMPRRRRIAIISGAIPADRITEEGVRPNWSALYVELRRYGYLEGKNLAIDRISAEGHPERFPDLAREAVRRNPDLILSENTAIARALVRATTTIPIVSWLADPVRLGIVTSLAHPGGNITGVTVDAGWEITGKQLQIIKEAVPSASKVAYVSFRAYIGLGAQARGIEASRLRVEPVDLALSEASPTELSRVFAEAISRRADALSLGPDPEFLYYRQLIVELAEKYRLPALYWYPDFVAAGGLMSYGPDPADLAPFVAAQVRQILNGSKPSEIPILREDRFPLVLNLKAAHAISFTFPSSLLGAADRVVE